MSSYRASLAFAASAPALQDAALVESARAAVAAFREDLEAGRLTSAKHASLRLLEAALEPFDRAAAEAAELARLPARDLTPGDLRHGWAAGRPGA
ncbi:MAG TPA: hypothetical protein VGB54_11105 [Allosphingosinicella sp.]